MQKKTSPQEQISQKNTPTQSSVWGDEATQLFECLTPDTILRFVEGYGTRTTGRVLQLNSMENRVYQVELDIDNNDIPLTHPDRYRIVKFYRPGRWTFEQIKEEHDFLSELAAEEFPIVSAIPRQDTERIVKDPETGLYACVYPRVGGRNIDEVKQVHLSIIGRMLARLHVIGKRKVYEHRLPLTVDTYGDANLDLILSLEILPHAKEQTYIDLVEDIFDMIDPLFKDVAYQRVHGDCHLGNILEGPEGLFLVDFDDSVMAPPVQDIWLIEGGRDDYSIKRREELLRYYLEFSDFDFDSLNLIEPLRTLRIIHFTAWIGKRYQDQAFKKSYPEFATPEYWSEMLETLSEQAELIAKL